MGDQGERNDIAVLIKTVVDSSKSQTEMNSRILDEVRGLKDAVERTNETLTRLGTTVEAHEKILRGNGTEGVLSRMARMEPLVDEHQDTLRGKEDKPGLVGRVNQLDSRSESVSRPLWLVLASLIGAGITSAVNHFLK